jgi:hypothetical protein
MADGSLRLHSHVVGHFLSYFLYSLCLLAFSLTCPFLYSFHLIVSLAFLFLFNLSFLTFFSSYIPSSLFLLPFSFPLTCAFLQCIFFSYYIPSCLFLLPFSFSLTCPFLCSRRLFILYSLVLPFSFSLTSPFLYSFHLIYSLVFVSLAFFSF